MSSWLARHSVYIVQEGALESLELAVPPSSSAALPRPREPRWVKGNLLPLLRSGLAAGWEKKNRPPASLHSSLDRFGYYSIVQAISIET